MHGSTHGQNILGPRALVTAQQARIAGVAAGLPRSEHRGKHARILQAQVGALACERMNHVRGIAGERNARRGQPARRQAPQGEAALCRLGSRSHRLS